MNDNTKSHFLGHKHGIVIVLQKDDPIAPMTWRFYCSRHEAHQLSREFKVYALELRNIYHGMVTLLTFNLYQSSDRQALSRQPFECESTNIEILRSIITGSCEIEDEDECENGNGRDEMDRDLPHAGLQPLEATQKLFRGSLMNSVKTPISGFRIEENKLYYIF